MNKLLVKDVPLAWNEVLKDALSSVPVLSFPVCNFGSTLMLATPVLVRSFPKLGPTTWNAPSILLVAP